MMMIVNKKLRVNGEENFVVNTVSTLNYVSVTVVWTVKPVKLLICQLSVNVVNARSESFPKLKPNNFFLQYKL